VTFTFTIKRDTTFFICNEYFGSYIKWPPRGKYVKQSFYKKETWHGIPDISLSFTHLVVKKKSMNNMELDK